MEQLPVASEPGLRSEVRPARRPRGFKPPSIPAVVFVLLSLLVPLGLQQPLLNSDGDLARHLRHGRYMLEHGSLIRNDPFSFTRPGAPFVGFEYGSQIAYALAERGAGLPGVTVLAGLLIALTYTLLARLLLDRGVDPLLAYLTVAIAAALGAGHWLARPHLFSFVAVVLLLWILERRPSKPLLWSVLLFGVWANLHGGFSYGLIVTGLYLVGGLGELWWGKYAAGWRERVRYYAVVLAAGGLATLLNPHGLDLHRYLVEFFGKQFIMDHTAEFVSPDFHEVGGRLLLAAILLCLASLSLYQRRPTLPHLLVICAGTAFALISVRNVALFGLTALPVLALHLDPLWRRLPDPRGIRGRFAITAAQTSTLPWMGFAAFLLALVLLLHGRIAGLRLLADHFDDKTFPVAAVQQARKESLSGRLFSEFGWGGYLVYAWPEQKIFIDGGTDFFGEEIFRDYSQVKRLVPGWRARLAKWDISLMLLNRQTTLAHELARDGRWTQWYCDSLAVIFRRSPARSAMMATVADSAERRLDDCYQPAARPPRRLDE